MNRREKSLLLAVALLALVFGAKSAWTQGTSGWKDGDVITYARTEWGDSTSTAGNLLSSQFHSLYTSGQVGIGIPDPSGYSAAFTDPSFIMPYLSATGTYAPLAADLTNPNPTSSDAFGAEVLALELNVDFSGLTGGTHGVAFGDLRLCNMADSSLNGTTISSFLGLVNTLLAGGFNGYAISDLGPLTASINGAFDGGSVTSFAQQHLINGTCQ